MANDLEKRLVAALRKVGGELLGYGPLCKAIADELERTSPDGIIRQRDQENKKKLIDAARQMRKDADTASDSGDKILSVTLHNEARHLEQFIREKWGIGT